MNESRIKELLNWLDDKAADTSMPYREMANYRDVSTAMRQMIQRESSAQLLTEKWRRQAEGLIDGLAAVSLAPTFKEERGNGKDSRRFASVVDSASADEGI